MLRFAAFAVYFNVILAAQLWNPATDPLPPVQPAEMSATLYNSDLYTLVESGEVVSRTDVFGYQFNSFSKEMQMTVASGSNEGLPVLQIAYNNYANPSADNSSLLAQYNTQTCSNGPIEGESPYPGYNYYQEYLQLLYSSGIPIYFEYVILPEYGLSLRYSAELPWNNPALPRNLTYTLTFQNSTGYLLTYDLYGTEYCCPGANLYCPNSGNCSDGTIPQLTYAITNQTYYDYLLYEASDWPAGFFGAYCPFTESVPTATPTSTVSNSNNGMSNQDIIVIVLAALLGLSILFNIYFTLQAFRGVQRTKQSDGKIVNENPLQQAAFRSA